MNNIPKPNNQLLYSRIGGTNMFVLGVLWLITFIIYLPTAKAGWVIDAASFIHNIRHKTFWNYLNHSQVLTQSLYQFYAFQFIVFYKLWGMNPWMWSLLYITLHAFNGLLSFIICKNIFSDSGVKNGVYISLCGAILFTICPHISEVMVWRACIHYLQSFLFILLSLLWVQKYQHNQRLKYISGSAILMSLCCLSLEIFYLIPFFSLSIALYYRFALNFDKKVFRQTILYFFLLQLIILGLYFVALYARDGYIRPHVNNVFTQSAIEYLSKPPKYFLHILLLGRYLSPAIKDKIYAVLESVALLTIFYGIVITLCLSVIIRFRKISSVNKAMFLLFVWTMITIAFLMPLPFPGSALLIFYDRYTYFADGFVYTLLVLLVSRIGNKYVAFSLLSIYAVINLYFTVKINTWWKHSAYIINRLTHDLPDPGNKTVVLLNIPENMNGAPMIGSSVDGEYSLMREILIGKQPENKIYDGASYNMITDNDGAHVTVINDSVLHVTLNQWGTWWWYEGHGCKSYENEYYKLNMTDVGHLYELTLKKPADQYLLLYSVGPQWKIVNMNKKNEDQY